VANSTESTMPVYGLAAAPSSALVPGI
jgi:hypothetical protein